MLSFGSALWTWAQTMSELIKNSNAFCHTPEVEATLARYTRKDVKVQSELYQDHKIPKIQYTNKTRHFPTQQHYAAYLVTEDAEMSFDVEKMNTFKVECRRKRICNTKNHDCHWTDCTDIYYQSNVNAATKNRRFSLLDSNRIRSVPHRYIRCCPLRTRKKTKTGKTVNNGLLLCGQSNKLKFNETRCESIQPTIDDEQFRMFSTELGVMENVRRLFWIFIVSHNHSGGGNMYFVCICLVCKFWSEFVVIASWLIQIAAAFFKEWKIQVYARAMEKHRKYVQFVKKHPLLDIPPPLECTKHVIYDYVNALFPSKTWLWQKLHNDIFDKMILPAWGMLFFWIKFVMRLYWIYYQFITFLV